MFLSDRYVFYSFKVTIYYVQVSSQRMCQYVQSIYNSLYVNESIWPILYKSNMAYIKYYKVMFD